MKRFEVVQYATDAELAQAATELWLKRVAEDRCRHGGHHVALSGGRIARNLFAAILHTTRAAPTELDTVHFFWADERCVPPDDPESNFGVAKTLLLDPLGIPQPRVHRIQGESPPDQAAAQASRNLAARVPVGPNGVPILDFVFLGMGEDGHVASLFPGGPGDSAQDPSRFYLPVTAPKPPPRRISLNYSVLSAAREVCVLIAGGGKEEALARSLSAGQTPLGRLLERRERTLLLTSIPLGPLRGAAVGPF